MTKIEMNWKSKYIFYSSFLLKYIVFVTVKLWKIYPPPPPPSQTQTHTKPTRTSTCAHTHTLTLALNCALDRVKYLHTDWSKPISHHTGEAITFVFSKILCCGENSLRCCFEKVLNEVFVCRLLVWNVEQFRRRRKHV